MTNILVIDDDIEFCETMESLVKRMGFSCMTANLISDGLAVLSSESIDIVLLDVRLPDGNGLDALQEIKKSDSDPEVIILTGQGDPDGAELAIEGGVWDYLLKPTSIKQTRLSLTRALRYREEKQVEKPLRLNLDNVTGKSEAMKRCYDIVAKAAGSNSQVLITGETGTGKELFARTIHENSNRLTFLSNGQQADAHQQSEENDGQHIAFSQGVNWVSRYDTHQAFRQGNCLGNLTRHCT